MPNRSDCRCESALTCERSDHSPYTSHGWGACVLIERKILEAGCSSNRPLNESRLQCLHCFRKVRGTPRIETNQCLRHSREFQIS